LFGLVGVAAALILGLAYAAVTLTDDDDDDSRPVTLAAVLDEPDRYRGERLEVQGIIDEPFSDRAFTMVTGPTLVLLERGATQNYDMIPGEVVVATAELVTFDLDLARERTGMPLPDDEYARFEGSLALLAERAIPDGDATPADPPPSAGGS
jgi:hypothetical protein